MGKRYSKNYSNYILKKKYQYTTKGTIWERDWVTIGAKHQIEKGKRPFFGDSGFLFTDNSFVSTQKRHDFGKVVAEWLYDDVKDASTQVNKTELNYLSNDLRDFAYYGSAVELVRSSILNIINYFPACAFSSTQRIEYPKGSNKFYNVINNPFGIDFSTDNIKSDDVKNPMRFMSLSAYKYELKCFNKTTSKTNVSPITEYVIKPVENPDTCKDVYEIANAVIASSEVVDENRVDFKILLKILVSYGKVIVVENSDTNSESKNRQFRELRPVQSVIDSYFENLYGFEKLLLRTDTIPLYKNKFLKMFETENGIRYAYRDYVWPRINDYCIDIESPSYVAFVDGLIDTSTEFDEMWCDNLWRNMTHESLRNYDWTYTKTYINGEEEPNIEGGNRLEKLVRIYGRFFDDIKRYIDGIKFSAKVSYDGNNNMPDAEISDRLSYNGWEIYSTIPSFKWLFPDEDELDMDLSTTFIGDDYISKSAGDGKPKWFNAVNPSDVSASSNDIDFLRGLSLSSKSILKAKGTTNGIDMVMALFGVGSDYGNLIVELTKSVERLEKEAEMETEQEKIDEINAKIEGIKSEIESIKEPTYHFTERYFVTDVKNGYQSIRKTIADLVHYDEQNWFYDDPYEGVPFGEVQLHNKNFIIPFYDSDKYYKGEFTFHSNGGWYKKSLEVDSLNDYEETLSYLNVAPTFESLFTVNTYSLDKVGENAQIPPSNIYYVVDPSDYIKYDENAPYNQTHYFYIRDIYNPELADSWKPILYEYIDFEETISVSEYNALHLYTKADGVDLGLPEYIDDTEVYNELGYAFICNNEISNAITRDEYADENTNWGYVYDNECQWRSYKPVTHKLLFEFGDCSGCTVPSSNPLYNNDIHSLCGLSDISDGIYENLGYMPKFFVRFNEDGSISADRWLSMSPEQRLRYPIDEYRFCDGIQYNYLTDWDSFDPSIHFDLKRLYYGYHELTRSSYTDLQSFYISKEDTYAYIENEGGAFYAKKYPGDIALYERAKYLDSIISTNIGNNPHVGYGRYDLGQEFKSYMEYPFKYYEDNYVLPEEQALSTYTLRFDVTNEALSDYVNISQADYESLKYTRSSNILFKQVENTVNIMNMNSIGNTADIMLRFFNIPRRRIPSMTSRIGNLRAGANVEIVSHAVYTDVFIHVEDEPEDEIETLLMAVNRLNTITYKEYEELPSGIRRDYQLIEETLLEAFNDVSDEMTDEYDLDLKELYKKDHYTFSDFHYGITEYNTTNKVKVTANTFNFQDGYVTEMSEEEWETASQEMTPEERERWEREIAEVVDGVTHYKYVKSITIDEYNELTPGEKENYKKTIAKQYTRGRYRDDEDRENDTLIDEDTDWPVDTLPMYYLNSKVIILEFLNTNELFKRYFLNVIGKYVMQVMPSTAITVVLFDCDETTTDDENGQENG